MNSVTSKQALTITDLLPLSPQAVDVTFLLHLLRHEETNHGCAKAPGQQQRYQEHTCNWNIYIIYKYTGIRMYW